MSSLTPLETLPDFDEALRKRLAEYWITTAEEFSGTYRMSANARAGLARALGVPEERVRALFNVANSLPGAASFDAGAELEVGFGLDISGLEDVEESSFDTTDLVNLPENVEPLGPLPPTLNQGTRNTCVTFSLAALYQIASGDPTDLSEQFLYWACKQRDGLAGDSGTRPDVALKALQELGICTEATWPYSPQVNQAQPGHAEPSAAAKKEALLRRISRFTQLPAKSVGQIQVALSKGRGVLIGLNIFDHWTLSGQGTRLGRVRRPLLSEQRKGGHAMAAVGYRTDASSPGGGYFIVRNSWGPAWATENPDGPGYCYVPFRLIAEQSLAAFVIDEVLKPNATAPKPGTTRIVASSLRAGAALGSAQEEAESPFARYGDLRELQGRLSALSTTHETLRDEIRAIRKNLSSMISDEEGRLSNALALSGAELPALPDPAPEPSAGSDQSTDQPPAVAAQPAQLVDQPPTASAQSAQSVDQVVEQSDYLVPFVEVNPAKASSGPLILVSKGGTREELYRRADVIEANGINGVTGELLLQVDIATAAEFVNSEKEESEDSKIGRQGRSASAAPTLFGVDMADIQQSRWAIVVSAFEDSAVLKALTPLIQYRSKQQGIALPDLTFRDGETCGDWLGRYVNPNSPPEWEKRPPVLLYYPGQSTSKWLAQHGTSIGPVNPQQGVPYYIMIVGRPGPLNPSDKVYVPYLFQYELDIFWGVGRICFNDVEGHHRLPDYTVYAERLVAWDTLGAAAASRLSKEIAYFGTRHETDKSTERSADELITPLVNWHTAEKSYAKRKKFDHRLLLGDDATRDNLGKLLSSDKPPAVLFTATHGIGMPVSDPKQVVSQQGSLVCSEWEGFGRIKRDHWLSGENIGELSPKVEGMIAFFFACYGAGCPQQDEFIFDEKRQRPLIAPFAFVAQLPQQLLLNGSLAVLGHVERAWTYSFSGTENVKGQIQGFQDVLTRIMGGQRMGEATDTFNLVQGGLASQLANLIEQSFKADDATLVSYWMARNDARNYSLLGDPAVQLPFDLD